MTRSINVKEILKIQEILTGAKIPCDIQEALDSYVHVTSDDIEVSFGDLNIIHLLRAYLKEKRKKQETVKNLKEGVRKAKENGVKFGRPRIHYKKRQKIEDKLLSGLSVAKTSLELNVSKGTVATIRREISKRNPSLAGRSISIIKDIDTELALRSVDNG